MSEREVSEWLGKWEPPLFGKHERVDLVPAAFARGYRFKQFERKEEPEMVGKSRYCYSPAVICRISRRLTLADRWRRWRKRREEPDVYRVTGYNQPIWIRH